METQNIVKLSIRTKIKKIPYIRTIVVSTYPYTKNRSLTVSPYYNGEPRLDIRIIAKLS